MKENDKYSGIGEAVIIKQAEIKEQITTQKNVKASRSQVLQKKSHQRDKHLANLPCEILRTIFTMDLGGTLTNGPEDKKIDEYAPGLTSKR